MANPIKPDFFPFREKNMKRDEILLIPKSIQCPHCGQPIETSYIATYFGKITGVKMEKEKDDRPRQNQDK